MLHDRNDRTEQDRSRGGRPGARDARGTARAPSEPPPRGPISAAAATAVLVLALALPAGLAAQEGHGERDHGHGHDHGGRDGHHAGLHFTHPLIAESVSPDTKLRLDHRLFDFPDGDRENSGLLEAEFAFARSFSVEAGLPFSYTEGEPGNLEAKLKFANFAFEDAGLLLGYGLEVGFPTNGDAGEASEDEAEESLVEPADPVAASRRASDEAPEPPGRPSVGAPEGGPPPAAFSGGGAGVEGTLGTDEWEVAPFLNVGWKRGPVELVAWGFFGIPFDQAEQDEVATEISWNVSGMYHLSPRVQALVELDGSGGISGEAVGEDVVSLSPGVRVQVLPDSPLVLGSSVGFPLANEEPFDVRWKTSLFWHFPR